MTDAKIRAMLGMIDRIDAPVEKSERLDLSRCVTYPTRSKALAEARFREKYGVTPTVSMEASIGGRTKVGGWLCGMTPVGWSEDTV